MAVRDGWFQPKGPPAEGLENIFAKDAGAMRDGATRLANTKPDLELKRDSLALRAEEGDAEAAAAAAQIDKEIADLNTLVHRKRCAAEALDRKSEEAKQDRVKRQRKTQRRNLINESAACLPGSKRAMEHIHGLAAELAPLIAHRQKVLIGWPGGANADVQRHGLLHIRVLMAAIEQELFAASRRYGVALPGASVNVLPERWPGLVECVKDAHEYIRAALSDDPPPAVLVPALPTYEPPPSPPESAPETSTDGLEDVLGLPTPPRTLPLRAQQEAAIAGMLARAPAPPTEDIPVIEPATVLMQLPEIPQSAAQALGIDINPFTGE